jgi:hypothetical protein
MKKPKVSIEELEAAYAEQKAGYHDASAIENRTQLEARETRIAELYKAINDAICDGAKGENLYGIRRQVGVNNFTIIKYFEIGDGENVATGVTQAEVVSNWNNGVFGGNPAA